MAQIDFSLQNRIPDGNGKLLVGDLSPTDGSYTTENQYLTWMKGKILYSGYLYNGDFYKESAHTNVISKVDGAIYVDLSDGSNLSLYYCDNTTYKALTEEAQVQAIRTELANGTLVPLKATQDSLGNQIDTTYAKKSDLLDGTIVVKEAEIATKDEDGNNIKATYETKADASELKNAIDNNSQRIENLEVAVSGSLVQTNVLTDPPSMANVRTITNANEILPWAILKRVGARAVAWNQMAKAWSEWSGSTGATLSISGDTLTVTTTATSLSIRQTSIPYVVGHEYVYSVAVKCTKATDVCFGDGDSAFGSVNISANTWTTLNFKRSATSASSQIRIYVARTSDNLTSSDSVEMKYAMLFDLTTMNEASLTADQFRTLFPASYYPYTSNPSIIPLNPSAFKVVGKQKWDEQIVVGGLQSDGTVNTSETDRITTDWIPVLPNTGYYIKTPQTTNGRACFYDAEKNLILYNGSFPQTGTFTTPPNACWMRDTPSYAYGTTYNHDILICLNSVTDKTYEAYNETTIFTPQIADGHYVNESCYDYVENVIEDGQVKGKFHDVAGKVDSSDASVWSGWYYDSTSQTFRLEYSEVKCGNNNVALAGYLVAPYTQGSSAMVNMTIKLHDNDTIHRIYVKNTAYDNTTIEQFKASLGVIYFENETEVITDVDPIPNIPCEDGTTVQAVTPQTDLVNAIDVPSTIAYMTKIGG